MKTIRFAAATLLFLVVLLAYDRASSTSPLQDPGRGDGKDVVMIGDSWMAYGAQFGIQQSLLQVSRQPYRAYGSGGTQLLNGQIPSQYALARRENPNIKTVIMTGGGNDLLLSDARLDLASAGPNARAQIDRLAARLVALWNEMGRDGVKDIVYIYYSRGGGIAASVNYGTGKTRPMCEAITPAHCHWIDSDETIHMMLRDGIHPTDSGFSALGKMIIDLMGKAGMRR